MIAIIGGGVIGLSIALELARTGEEDVRVYDRAEPGRAASWAAAGMLAPYTEELPHPALQALCERSLQMFEQYVSRIEALSGVDVQLRASGILSAAFDEQQEQHLIERERALTARGIRAQLLDPHEVAVLEPAVSHTVRRALLVEAEGHVDNRRLTRALREACMRSGVTICEHTDAIVVEMDSRRVLGVRSSSGYAAASAVVNAAGVAAGDLAGVARECVVPMRGVKGQIVELAVPELLMRRPVWVPGAYLVPRANGRLLIGATVEDASDVRVTAQGVATLLEAALAGAPALRDFSLVDMWAGLRPRTPDGLPVLGATRREGYFVAAGHYRNGILLAPVTGEIVARAIHGERLPDLQPFAIGRFQALSACG